MKRKPDHESGPRAAAAEVVREWLETGRYPDRLVAQHTDSRPFLMEVVYGIARWRRTLEWVVRRCARRIPEPPLLSCLLVGLYQVLLMDRVAPHAAVHETVEAARVMQGRVAAGFVNAVLRRVLREEAAIRTELASQPLAVRTSHPDILVERWSRHFGPERTEALCNWNNARPAVIVRPNRRKLGFEAFLASLDAAGIAAAPHPAAPHEYAVLPRGVKVTSVPGYDTGLFSVQDPAARISVARLDPQPGERVLDACAAPGGKMMLIAEAMHGQGRLVAMDKHDDRLATLKENVARLQLGSVVATVRGDAARERDIRAACKEDCVDRILLDVPCSNTGVLQRRPDARWAFSQRRMAGLARTQRALLDATSRFLAPGGTLVYSTCSLEPEECRDVVQAWLGDNPAFRLVKADSLFPPEAGTDGAYVATCRRED